MSARDVLAGLMLCFAAGVCRCSAAANPLWVGLSSPTAKPPETAVLSSGAGETVLRVEVPGYLIERIAAGGDACDRLAFPGCSFRFQPGEPMLPVLILPVPAPRTGELRVTIERRRTRWIPVPDYLPAPMAARRGAGGLSPAPRAAAYRTEAAFPVPDALVVGRRQVQGRDVAVLQVYPFLLHPLRGGGELATELIVRVGPAQPSGPSAHAMPARTPQRVAGPKFTDSMLIVCGDDFHAAMRPFVQWKRQKGLPTDLVLRSEAGSTASNIALFVQARYREQGMTHLLLVGDSEEMPALPGTKGNMVGQPSDLRYVLLEGDDLYPDAWVSRFPAKTAEEASNLVARTLQYEKGAMAAGDWYRRGCGASSSSAAGGYTDYERNGLIRDALLGFTYTHVDHFYGDHVSAALISEALNEGRSILNLIGHGDAVSWSWLNHRNAPKFTTGDVAALTNTNQLPFVIIVGCDGGMYSAGNCLAESFLRAGSPEWPCGAIAVHAAYTEEWAVPPCTAQAETIDLLVSGAGQALGPLCFGGVIKALDVHTETVSSLPGTFGEELAEQLHLFGDGSLVPYTAPPAPMDIRHAGTLAAWQGRYDVEVPGVSNALCALYEPGRNRLLGCARTDASGIAPIRLTDAPREDLTLTVTAFNRLPAIETVAVDTADQPPGTILQIR